MADPRPAPYLYLRSRDAALVAFQEAAAALGASYDGKAGHAPEGLGDFSFACHPMAKALRKAPLEIANAIAQAARPPPQISFAAAGPYVNATIDASSLTGVGLLEILRAGAAVGTLAPTGRRILVEHTSANPNGPLHVGRARNPIIGDSVCRLLKRGGNDVKTEFFVNDIGKQLVTLAWGANNLKDKDLQGLPSKLEAAGVAQGEIEPLRNLATQGVDRGKDDHLMVRFYQAATALAKIDPQVEAAIVADVQAIERGDSAVLARVDAACNLVLGGMQQSLLRLNVHFDSMVYESTFIVNGAVFDVVRGLKALAQAREEDGAWYIDLAEFGIAGRTARYVFVRADGTTLYATRDVAYHLDKASRCDRGITVLGEDQKLAARQVEIALKLLGSPFVPEPLFYAFVSLPEGKMSTRRGRVVSIDDLLDEAVERAKAEVDKRRPDMDAAAKARIAEAVGVGSVRYNIVRVQPEKSIVFRWEEALNFEGNSAPFVQYAHARACSILRKAAREELIGSPSIAESQVGDGTALASEPACVKLARTLARFPLIVEEACAAVRPHHIAAYSQEAASAFNEFYRDVPVIGSGPSEGSKLGLVAAARATLAATLDLSGIEPLVEM